jgi:hypothetical protein
MLKKLVAKAKVEQATRVAAGTERTGEPSVRAINPVINP